MCLCLLVKWKSLISGVWQDWAWRNERGEGGRCCSTGQPRLLQVGMHFYDDFYDDDVDDATGQGKKKDFYGDFYEDDDALIIWWFYYSACCLMIILIKKMDNAKWCSLSKLVIPRSLSKGATWLPKAGYRQCWLSDGWFSGFSKAGPTRRAIPSH